MDGPTSTSIRYLALAGIVGGGATALSGVAIQAVVQPASTVSEEMWSYPWPSDVFVPVTALFAGLHLLVFLGVLGFARSGVAGTGRSARAGSVLALVGTAVFFLAEMASIPLDDQRLDDPGPQIVGGIFGLGVLLTAVGLLLAGWATLRAARWRGWRRGVPLAAGIWTAVLVGVSVTKALPTGVGVYGLCILALAVALYTRPTAGLTGTGSADTRTQVVN